MPQSRTGRPPRRQLRIRPEGTPGGPILSVRYRSCSAHPTRFTPTWNLPISARCANQGTHSTNGDYPQMRPRAYPSELRLAFGGRSVRRAPIYSLTKPTLSAASTLHGVDITVSLFIIMFLSSARSSVIPVCRPKLVAGFIPAVPKRLSTTSTIGSTLCSQSLRGPRRSQISWLPGPSIANRSIATAIHQSREDIVDSIKGQTLRLPDIERLFEGWPRVLNPHQHLVSDVVNDVLERYTVSPTALAKLTKNRLDHLLAVWYPFASPERLEELAYFVCWMFILDDEVDIISAAGKDNEAAFYHIWHETLRVSSESCALNEADDSKPWRKSEFESVESFRGIGQWLKTRYTVEQRQRFWDEIQKTSESYVKEQRIRKLQEIPQYDAYCDYRYGSCCMAQVVSMIEYANESQIPADIMESPEMKAVWAETTKLLWLNNDIVSVKKEVADGFLENLVVIASNPGYRLQDGLDHCVEKLAEAIISLDKAASILEAKYVSGKGDEVSRDVERFIINSEFLRGSDCLRILMAQKDTSPSLLARRLYDWYGTAHS
ncbi:isoprenoid synthase domain-containing protein [Xylariales sp. PMI_506]|nr:isoprenoid synthase domain-containing protein [Xylariales sp. PMI_506]